MLQLVYKDEFGEDVVGVAEILYDEQCVADVELDVSAEVRIERDVAHRPLPHTVEIDSDQVAFRINDRAAGVAACGVVRGEEADRSVSVVA